VRWAAWSSGPVAGPRIEGARLGPKRKRRGRGDGPRAPTGERKGKQAFRPKGRERECFVSFIYIYTFQSHFKKISSKFFLNHFEFCVHKRSSQ